MRNITYTLRDLSISLSKKYSLSLFIALVLSATTVNAQTLIQGSILDNSEEPVIGAVVTINGTQTGTASDVDGKFELQTSQKLPFTLTVKLIGYKTKEINITTTTKPLNILLEEDTKLLDEVVVIGYGTQNKQNVASAISSIKSSEFKDVPSTSVDQVLQGRVTGLNVTTPSGNVGQAPIVRVRGINSITSGTSPLYVVDGIPIQSGNPAYSGDMNALSDINPEDIESVDVLKDAAAAAVYGSRAANGVVLITTKRGKKGETKVSYNTWLGISHYAKFFDMMNAQQYVDYKNLAVRNRYGTDEISLTNGYTSPYGTKAFNMWQNADGSHADTDWKDEVFRTGVQQNHSVSVSGATDKFNYYMSGNYTDQDGILKGDHYNRLGASANVSGNATEWLKIGGKLSASNSTLETADRSRKGQLFAYSGFTRLAMSNAPNIPVYGVNGLPYEENGTLGYGPNTIRYPMTNPAAVLESNSLVQTDYQRIIYNFWGEISPIQGLTVRTQYGKDYLKLEDRNFNARSTVEGFEQNGIATNIESNNEQYTWSNTANYKLNIDKNHFDVMLGTETFERKIVRWGAKKTNQIDNSYSVYEAAFKNIESMSEVDKRSEAALQSYFGRINYDYDSRYIFSVNLRRDGYSALSPDNRWGTFGGVSAAWRISDEEFFKPLSPILSNMKIRGSWGVVGNTNIDDYASKSFYNTGYYGQNGSYEIGQIGDEKNLKWETSNKYDVGFSVDLYDRFFIDFDYYHTVSSDLILNVPVAPSLGIPKNYITTNAGKMKNSGIELNIAAQIIETKDFSWNASLNFTTNKNEVLALSDNVQELISTTSTAEITNMTVVGKSIGQLYLYKTGGIDEATGRRIFYGKNGEKVLLMFEKDGKFFTEDGNVYKESDLSRELAGNTIPTWYGGFTNNFKYKNFDLSLLFQFSGGNKIYNGTIATLGDLRWWNNSIDVQDNYWTPDRTNAKYALPIWGDNYSNGSAKPITDWVENGDYLRLKNISLGYTFDTKKWPKSLGISGLRVYAQVQNLFVLTGYSGLDPEVLSNTHDANLSGGTDHNTAPQAKTYTLGVNLTF